MEFKIQIIQMYRWIVSMCVCVCLTILCGDVDVEVETVLALVLQVSRSSVQVFGEPHWHHDFRQRSMDILRTCGREACGIPHIVPGPRSFWRLEPAISGRWCGVWNAKKLFYRAKDLIIQLLPDATDFPVTGGNNRMFGGTVFRALA